MLERYEEFFGNRLAKFIEEVVPEKLSGLSPSELDAVSSGDGAFPRDLVRLLQNGAEATDEKISKILVVIGSWMNSSSGSDWAIGPLEDGPYSERAGIGISDGVSFIPLLALVERIVAEGPAESSTLDLVASMAEFNKKHAK
ncbi:hypothetical protein [Corynebacterium epidermidicanis]|uniref:Uncharacterized protein n=1 Tax=Corynebacterium epidermidicanis TaxID=1050174 RepID=A0A0G3GN88_9CORY|nr:hypothetical protein [Corynebacterium epidermidicanis]AKK02651.1 hypothetical protein CEPID_03890 [Corynebacterium epidermidicanis]